MGLMAFWLYNGLVIGFCAGLIFGFSKLSFGLAQGFSSALMFGAVAGLTGGPAVVIPVGLALGLGWLFLLFPFVFLSVSLSFAVYSALIFMLRLIIKTH